MDGEKVIFYIYIYLILLKATIIINKFISLKITYSHQTEIVLQLLDHL